MLFIIIFNDNYCIFMFNYRGKSEEYKEYTAYNECHEEFKYGEFPFGLFGSIDFGCSSTRCQCYQHKLPIVMYSTIL